VKDVAAWFCVRIVAATAWVAVGGAAEAVSGTSQSAKSKKTNKNFVLRPRIHPEAKLGIPKYPFATHATFKFPAVPALHNYGGFVCE
jgi:hypothetical protein